MISRWQKPLLAACVIAIPLSLELRLGDPSAVPRWFVKLPLVDLCLWLALAVAVFVHARKLFATALKPALAVVVVALVATLPRLAEAASASELLQRVDTFLIAGLLFALAPAAARKFVLGPLLDALLLGHLAVAAITLLTLTEPPWRVTGGFEDRQLFGAWVAIVLATRIDIAPWTRGRLCYLGAVTLLAAVTATTALPAAALLIALVAHVSHRRDRGGFAAAAALLTIFTISTFILAPRANCERIVSGWRLTDLASPDELRARDAELMGLKLRQQLFTIGTGANTITLHTPNWHPRLPTEPDPRRIGRFEPNYVEQRYLEWQAAIYALAKSPAFGTGLGSYQARTSLMYLSFKKLKTLEPNSQSAYAVEAVSTGLVGVVTLLWLMISAWLSAAQSGRALAPVALRAGVVTVAVVAVAIPLFQSSLALLLVFLADPFMNRLPSAETKSEAHAVG